MCLVACGQVVVFVGECRWVGGRESVCVSVGEWAKVRVCDGGCVGVCEFEVVCRYMTSEFIGDTNLGVPKHQLIQEFV